MQKSTNINNKWLTNFCDSLRIFVSIVLIQIVVIIYSFSFFALDVEYLRKLSILTLLAQLIGMILVIAMCKLRAFFNRFKVQVGVSLLTLLVLVVTTILVQSIGSLDMQLTFYLLTDVADINYLNIKLSISTVLICLALVRYFYIQDQWQKQIQMHSRARLNALQARIKPHFLFNSLNSIAALIGIDSHKAELAITDFASLMRQAFTHKDKEITIAEEIKWVEQYLAIEKLRMGNRLTCKITCQPSLLQHKIPVLCIQPLVENAIIHGIALLEDGGMIEVEIYTQDNSIQVQVSNPYIKQENSQSNGMALDNISERLQLHYAQNASIVCKADAGIYQVNLRLPYLDLGL